MLKMRKWREKRKMEKDKKEQNEKQSKEKDAAPSTSGSAKKRRKSVDVEPRTPLKRQRVPVQRFQSPTEDLIPIIKAKTPKNEVELVYKKGVFLAVRGDAECVLTNVRMERVARETYELPEAEKARIELILSKALKKEKGEPYEDLVIDTEEEIRNEEDEEDEDEDDEPVPKKGKAKKSITVAFKEGKNGKKQQPPRGRSRKKEFKEVEVKKEKKTASPGKKRGPDKNLLPNPKIKILEKDPLFETKDHVPFISKRAHQRLVFRAVFQNDIDLLKQLLEDDQHIHDVSVHCKTS
uniref:Uncharacterized protein n=1 Tax=Magallana gigas TaxID=29159 RepID=K1QFP1_MAGGI